MKDRYVALLAILFCFALVAHAHAGILTDISGNPVMDGNGDCVRCESNTAANCDTKPPVFDTINGSTFQPDTATPVSAPSIAEPSCPTIAPVVKHDVKTIVRYVPDESTIGSLNNVTTLFYTESHARVVCGGSITLKKDGTVWSFPACPKVAPVAASEPRPVFAPVKTEPECKQEITFVRLILVGIIWLITGIICGRISKR